MQEARKTTMATDFNDVCGNGEPAAEICYRIASTRREREAAFRLVYHSYLRAGLGENNPYEMRVTPYHLLESTDVFVAECRGQIAFTMSLIRDGELGLPMESIYGEEVEQFRQQGLRLGEVSCLADRRAQTYGFFPVYMQTCRLMIQCARYRRLHGVVAAVHPKHARFYRRYMGFRAFGREKTYPTVRNNPAVALWLEFARIDRDPPLAYEFCFGEQIPFDNLQPQPISLVDREYFAPMIDPSFVCAPLSDTNAFGAAYGLDSSLGYPGGTNDMLGGIP
jgi:hypothetical protein